MALEPPGEGKGRQSHAVETTIQDGPSANETGLARSSGAGGSEGHLHTGSPFQVRRIILFVAGAGLFHHLVDTPILQRFLLPKLANARWA
jgi:hypothetical protein